jgi:hypothetical protein
MLLLTALLLVQGPSAGSDTLTLSQALTLSRSGRGQLAAAANYGRGGVGLQVGLVGTRPSLVGNS